MLYELDCVVSGILEHAVNGIMKFLFWLIYRFSAEHIRLSMNSEWIINI